MAIKGEHEDAAGEPEERVSLAATLLQYDPVKLLEAYKLAKDQGGPTKQTYYNIIALEGTTITREEAEKIKANAPKDIHAEVYQTTIETIAQIGIAMETYQLEEEATPRWRRSSW